MPNALKISTDGNVQIVQINNLKDLNEAVNGYIEFIHFTDIAHAYINENGKAENLPFNQKATFLCEKFKIGLMLGDYIVGNMIILGNSDDGEENDIPENLLKQIQQLIG